MIDRGLYISSVSYLRKYGANDTIAQTTSWLIFKKLLNLFAINTVTL